MQNWNDLVKSRMKEIHLSQEKLAEQLEVTQGAVAHWLSGRREPDLATINKMLTIVGLPILTISGQADTLTSREQPSEQQSTGKALYTGLNTISERIQQKMYEKGLKQADLVRSMGVSKGAVSLWLSGVSAPSGKNLMALAEVLNVSPYWLLTGGDRPPGRDEESDLLFLE